jgi:uncharacterized protein
MLEWFLAVPTLVAMAYQRAFAGSYTYAVLSVFWTLFVNLWYFMLLGSSLGVLVSRLVTRASVHSALEKRGMVGAALAAFVGLLSPACTFASIPVVGSLIASGFPVIPLVAFLVAAPLMNPSLFIITWGVMGSSMALARLVAAFALAMTAALLARTLAARGWLDLHNLVRNPGEAASAGGSCDIPLSSSSRNETRDGLRQRRPLWYEFYRMTWFVFRYFTLSLMVAAVIQVFVPASMVSQWMGGDRMESAVIGGLLGIPFYVCGGGAVATVAVLMSLNMGQGAALAFFLTGPATKVGTLVSLFAVIRPPLVILYLSVTLIGGTLLGTLYGLIAPEHEAHLVYAGQVEGSEDTTQYWQDERPPQTWQWNR